MINSFLRTLIITTAIFLGFLLPRKAAHAWEKRIDAHGKTIIAYYASWQWYDRDGLAKPSNLDHSKVTRYTFAFFQINSAGDIWGTDSWADPITLFGEFDWSALPGQGTEYCSWDSPGEPPACAGHYYDTGLIYQAHKAGVEVYPSIGGWTLSDPFPALAADPAASKRFAANCVKLIEAYDFDGIDIDWEYPGYADHSGTPEDTFTYSTFLQDIRDALDELGAQTGRFYGLTAALPCGPDLIDKIQIEVVKDIMTEFNLMTYDFHGSWNSETGANAPLYDMDGSPEFSVHGCVENWKAGGARPEQINIGLPFYGRSFSGGGITGFGQSFSGYADIVSWGEDEGSPQYFNIVKKLSEFTSVRDDQTMTQFMYNAHNGFVSYDDERAICDKTEYAMDNDLNGYIIWEISGDLLQDLSTPLLDATNDRLNNPDVRCDPEVLVATMDGVAEGNPFYPHPSLGFCVNDGKQADYFIALEFLFSSAELCCGSAYSYSSTCLSSSLDPANDGQYIAGLVDENPFYPHPTLRFCLNDGKQADYYISDEFLFSSAEVCCDSAFSFSSTCLSSSLDPINDGQYIAGLVDENPFYPHPSLEFCLNDGKQADHFIAYDRLFSSAEACCDSAFSASTTCLSTSLDPGDDGMWYPSGNRCISESPRPNWIVDVFYSEQECCDGFFGVHYLGCTGPISTQNPTPKPTPHPSLGPTKIRTVQPTPKPTPRPSPRPTKIPTAQPTLKPVSKTELINADAIEPELVTQPKPNNTGDGVNSFLNEWALADQLFYPNYEGTSGECLSGGNAPEWISRSMMKSSKYECCASSFFPSWVDQCNADHPFYPNFEEKSCVNDGMQPDWMVGDYLAENEWLCCYNFFQHNEELLSQCTGIAAFGCADCELSQYLTDYFSTGIYAWVPAVNGEA